MNIEVPFVANSPAAAEIARAHELERFNLSIAKPRPSDRPEIIGQLVNLYGFSIPIDFTSYKQSRRQRHEADYEDIYPKLDISNDAGLATYEVPDEFAQFIDPLQQIASYEHKRYPFARYSSVNLSVDQRPIKAGNAQRSGNDAWDRVHRDGYLGQWRHIYMVSSALPTEFYEGTSRSWTNCNLIGNRHLRRIGAQVGEIVFANITSLHRSPISHNDSDRTFMRLTYEYDPECLSEQSAA